MLVAIDLVADAVIWSGFEKFHRDWDYDLGPFVFDRRAYEAALDPGASGANMR